MRNQRFVQSGEREFIEKVVKAILQKDIAHKYYLFNDNGIIRYIAVPREQKVVDIIGSTGKSVKFLCIFGEELIEDFHVKAGNDDLSRPWAKRAVQKVIGYGKLKAEQIYKESEG